MLKDWRGRVWEGMQRGGEGGKNGGTKEGKRRD